MNQALFGQLLIGLINGAFYAMLSLGLAVVARSVDMGARVTRGQVLANLDPADVGLQAVDVDIHQLPGLVPAVPGEVELQRLAVEVFRRSKIAAIASETESCSNPLVWPIAER